LPAANLKAHTNAQITAQTDSTAFAVGVGAGADANNVEYDDPTVGNLADGVRINGLSQVVVGKGVVLQAKTVDLNAQVAKIDATARAEAWSFIPILIGVDTAFADARVNVDSMTDVTIGGDLPAADRTSITGTEGVDIRAHHDDVTTTRQAGRLAVALIPPQAARALGDDKLTNTVTGPVGATVYAGARTAATPLVKRANYPDESGPFAPLALFVEAANNNYTQNSDHSIHKADRYFDTNSATDHQTRTITWNSDVVISTGQTPELIVDANGNVAKATEVTVNGVKNPAVGTHVINAAGNIVVGNITNTGSIGDVIFEALGGKITRANVAPIGGHNWSTFYFNENFSGVRIANESTGNLVLNGIDLIHTTGQPHVDLVTSLAATETPPRLPSI
jgi:hypothetical protein